MARHTSCSQSSGRRQRLWPWLACLALLLSGPLHAYERDFYFGRIDANKGLAQSTVHALLQDRRGFIWIGTEGGLHRWDGYHLRRYRHDAARKASLPDNLITALADGKNRRLWVGSATGGLVLFDPSHDRTVPLPGGWTRHLGMIDDLAGGDGKRLWVATRGRLLISDPPYANALTLWESHAPVAQQPPVRQLTRCSDGRRYALAGDQLLILGQDAAHTRSVSLAALAPRALTCRRSGELLAGGAHGLYRIDPVNGRGTLLWPRQDDVISDMDADVRAIVEDHAHRLWLAVAHTGLVRLDNAFSPRLLRPRPNLAGGLPEAGITHLLVDRSGLLWAGTLTHGAAYAAPDGTPFRSILDRPPMADAVRGNNVRALYEDDHGLFWLGMGSNGLRSYDPGTQRFVDYLPVLARALPPGEREDLRIYSVAPGDHDSLWLATTHGVLILNASRDKAQRLQLHGADADITGALARTLMRDRQGRWWIGYFTRGVRVVDNGKVVARYQHDAHHPDDTLANDSVLSITQDAGHRIWLGTANGLSMVDPVTHRVRTFREHDAKSDSLSGHVITSLFVDKTGTLWVGTQTGLNRLLKINADGAHFKRILMRDGLPDATIYCTREDAQHRLWLSTNLGISRYDPQTEQVRTFGLRDGLQGMEYNSEACLQAHDGSLLFGGIHGFDRVQPASVQPSNFLPRVAITDLYVGVGTAARPMPDSGHLSVPKSARAVRFEFAAMDFAAPHHNRFQYRLEGFDQHWIDAGTRRSATYTNLDAGHYQFQVRGSNHEGQFGGPATTLDLMVTPPWWQSWPMLLLYGIGAALAAVAINAAIRARRSEERQHQSQLRDREDRLSMALWGSGDQFWDLNLKDGRLYQVGAQQLLGMAHAGEMSIDDWRNYIVHPDDLPRVQTALRAHLSGEADHLEIELRVRSDNDGWAWVLIRGKVVERDARGEPTRLSGTSRDITRTRSQERDRRIAAEVIRNMAEAVTVTDLSFRFASVNAAFTRMTGYSEADIVGRDASLLNCAQQSAETYAELRELVTTTGHWRGELWQRRKNGSEFLCWTELSQVCDAAGQRTHYVAVMTDITDRKRAEQELRYLANYDMLTGLPNRTLLTERLGDAILRARRNRAKAALLYVDLDRFKHINDSMGHDTGDRLLKAAGTRLRQCLREQDTVARVGGDEFTLILEAITDIADAEAVAQKIVEAFNAPLLLDTRQEVLISPSIGIALYPDHAHGINNLLKHADTAMYQAKERGRNIWMVYTDAMDASARLRATMAGALRRALEHGELSLVYQPKMALESGRIIGVEALLRWHNERLGQVSPAVFIPLAEETGLIVDIGEFVLNRACADLRRWREQGLTELSLAVNLSMAQLQRSELTASLRHVLATHGVPANRLELELTESMVMGNAEQSTRTLGELKAIGVNVAIDDFGTGYSSLGYLKRLPIDVLKIDQTFIADIAIDPDDEAITDTIITMAHSLGLRVVAEGVENEQQLAYLRNHGCDIIQGYWLARPMPAGECLDFCTAHQPGTANDKHVPAS
ncbi:EAL domain-containing protein [Oleiagrimonas sp. C23AA]|uniref:EAL domain-containing protein n=1 Tax=Oleiagrimonas sp. C23AA TaxID=2719047 RepID=UPI00141F57F4|nr:EAL domain-containing protein [Oleiagrimonas sp. C23AA]NII09775.1 EAL domain-containing protein [Oleiagrimonas sp. C23AA]